MRFLLSLFLVCVASNELVFAKNESNISEVKESYIQNILSDNIGLEDAIIKVEIDSNKSSDKYQAKNQEDVYNNYEIKNQSKFNESRGKELAIKNISLLNWNLNKNQGTFRVKIEYSDNKSEEVLGRFFIYKEAYVAARNIRRGNIISEDYIKTIVVPYAKKMDIPNIYDIIGKQSTKNILFGSLINTNHLVNPIVVRERDAVEIIYKSSNIRLKTKGIAMKSGVVGDVIRVKNDSSGIIIHATIVDKGIVEIDNK